jgi:hypothetical protein
MSGGRRAERRRDGGQGAGGPPRLDVVLVAHAGAAEELLQGWLQAGDVVLVEASHSAHLDASWPYGWPPIPPRSADNLARSQGAAEP